MTLSTPPTWCSNCDGRRCSMTLDRARVVAILNVTPDSFSDGGAYPTVEAAVRAAESALDAGAAGLDIGGESTRPGSQPVGAEEQVRRTAPVIAEIRRRLGDGFVISIDTTLAAVAAAAFDAGSDALNDTSAGRDDPAVLELVARRGAGLILMHRLRLASRDQFSTAYAVAGARGAPEYEGGVVKIVREFLFERAKVAESAGVLKERIVLDPGLGFGKTVEQNLELIRAAAEFMGLGYPVLSALSRKSFVGRVSGLRADAPASERLAGTLALSVVQYVQGVRLFRVHDVRAHVEALGAAASLQ